MTVIPIIERRVFRVPCEEWYSDGFAATRYTQDGGQSWSPWEPQYQSLFDGWKPMKLWDGDKWEYMSFDTSLECMMAIQEYVFQSEEIGDYADT